MLFSTFCHVPGIGEKTEQRLWQAGVLHWDDFVPPYPDFLSPQKARLIEIHLDESRTVLTRDRNSWAELLPSAHHWRFYFYLAENTVFLDIETNGAGGRKLIITTAALYDGAAVNTFVHGENMAELPKVLAGFDLFVTFNGRCFDLPVIERYFGVRFEKPHIDLRYLLAGLGFKGGLKKCEKLLGIDRGELDGVDGFFAVILWRHFLKTGDRRALETLLAYNVDDAVHLEILLHAAIRMKLANTPFQDMLPLAPPKKVFKPHQPDSKLIDTLRFQRRRL
jgi:uncharacterized protein YprB with RNaseH-like and TPR domain